MGTPVAADPFRYYRRLNRVREFVASNMSRQISLSECAEVAGLDPAYFSRFFYEKTGEHFRAWLTGRRIARAVELFAAHNYTVAEVSTKVGFGDLRTFQRATREHLGVTPSECKRRAKRGAPLVMSVVANGQPGGEPPERSERLA